MQSASLDSSAFPQYPELQDGKEKIRGIHGKLRKRDIAITVGSSVLFAQVPGLATDADLVVASSSSAGTDCDIMETQGACDTVMEKHRKNLVRSVHERARITSSWSNSNGSYRKKKKRRHRKEKKRQSTWVTGYRKHDVRRNGADDDDFSEDSLEEIEQQPDHPPQVQVQPQCPVSTPPSPLLPLPGATPGAFLPPGFPGAAVAPGFPGPAVAPGSMSFGAPMSGASGLGALGLGASGLGASGLGASGLGASGLGAQSGFDMLSTEEKARQLAQMGQLLAAQHPNMLTGTSAPPAVGVGTQLGDFGGYSGLTNWGSANARGI